MSEGRRLQQVLQQIGPFELAALHNHTRVRGPVALVVCDVALGSVQNVDLLRATLAQLDLAPGVPVLCLLRDPSHLTNAQAKMAGATATLLAQTEPNDLLGTVRALLPSPGPRGPEPARSPDLEAGLDTAGALTRDMLGYDGKKPVISAATLERASSILLASMVHARFQTWLDLVWAYDDVTYQHCLLVAGLATAFAIELGLPPKAQHLLSQAGLVHDIGKSQIPREILNKPGALTPAEMAIVRAHAALGHAMLVKQGGFNPSLLDAVRHHHEFLDGSGYPDGLNGAQICRLVRMVTICDIYAAMVERRPYKAPVDAKTALAQLAALGPKLDDALVKAFRNVVRDC